MTQRFLKSSEGVCRAKGDQSQSTVSPAPICGASARRNQRECVRANLPRRSTAGRWRRYRTAMSSRRRVGSFRVPAPRPADVGRICRDFASSLRPPKFHKMERIVNKGAQGRVFRGLPYNLDANANNSNEINCESHVARDGAQERAESHAWRQQARA